MPPVADFTAIPVTGTATVSVQFTDTSTNTPTSRAWNFGDGSTSTVQDPLHAYDNAGVYTVTLIATNINGSDTETKVDFIVIHTPNLYSVPAKYWNNMTDTERRLFNYYFLGGPQTKDISYSDGLNSNISIGTHLTVNIHNPSLYTARAPTTAYTAGVSLVSYNGVDYICMTSHISWAVFDETKFSDDNANVQDYLWDYKNIKPSLRRYSMTQNPVLGLVVTDPDTGNLINTTVSNYKAFADTQWNDMIKMIYHRVKTVTSFNI